MYEQLNLTFLSLSKFAWLPLKKTCVAESINICGIEGRRPRRMMSDSKTSVLGLNLMAMVLR
jgi:hypothetical protein